jgi:hypothetical protein
LSLGVDRVAEGSPVFRPGSLPVNMETPSLPPPGGSPTSGPGSPPVTMGTPALPLLGGSPTSAGTDGNTSEAAVVAIEGFADDPHNMEESPPGAEGDGELPLRAEGLGLVSL